MDFKITSTKSSRSQRRFGFTLLELMFSLGITGLLMTAVCSFSIFSGRSFAVLFNYVDLDDANRIAVDQITRDVRQANRVTAYAANSLTLEDSDGMPLSYSYDATARTLTRAKSGVSRVLLKQCDRLDFSIGQRNAVGGSYDVYPAATPATCKVVNVSWICSRTILGIRNNTESVQTARIVIRKQGT
jgi:prepilin-type N-terminal cleavage/methylation domain-containing protein